MDPDLSQFPELNLNPFARRSRMPPGWGAGPGGFTYGPTNVSPEVERDRTWQNPRFQKRLQEGLEKMYGPGGAWEPPNPEGVPMSRLPGGMNYAQLVDLARRFG